MKQASDQRIKESEKHRENKRCFFKEISERKDGRFLEYRINS